MSITQEQLNAGKAILLDLLVEHLPPVYGDELLDGIFAIGLERRKATTGGTTQREIANAVLNDAFETAYGVSPVGLRAAGDNAFRQQFYRAVQLEITGITEGMSDGDVHDPTDVEVTP